LATHSFPSFHFSKNQKKKKKKKFTYFFIIITKQLYSCFSQNILNLISSLYHIDHFLLLFKQKFTTKLFMKQVRASPAMKVIIAIEKGKLSTLTTIYPIFSSIDLLFNSLLTFKYYFSFFFYYIFYYPFPFFLGFSIYFFPPPLLPVRPLFLVLSFSFRLKHTERDRGL